MLSSPGQGPQKTGLNGQQRQKPAEIDWTNFEASGPGAETLTAQTANLDSILSSQVATYSHRDGAAAKRGRERKATQTAHLALSLPL